jgi:hypothetical protein
MKSPERSLPRSTRKGNRDELDSKADANVLAFEPYSKKFDLKTGYLSVQTKGRFDVARMLFPWVLVDTA